MASNETLEIEAEISVHEADEVEESETNEGNRVLRSSTKKSKPNKDKSSRSRSRDRRAEASSAEEDEEESSDANNIESLRKRGKKPGDHGYIHQPKGLKPKAALITVKRNDRSGDKILPEGLFTSDVVTAIVGAAAGRARCTVKTVAIFSPVNFLIATPHATTLIGLCDELMKQKEWLGIKVTMCAQITDRQSALAIIEAAEAREADKLREKGDARDETFLKERKQGESPRRYFTPEEEQDREQIKANLRTNWETKKFLRKPEAVIWASQIEDTTPVHVKCSMCGGLGHNHMKCPTRLLMVASHLEDNPTMEEDRENKNPNKTDSSSSVNSQTFGGKPPKLPKFSGDSSKDSVSYAQWQFEVQTHSLNYTESKMKEAIVVALTGTAADIIRMMGRNVSVEEILKKLSSIYGTIGTMDSMLEAFYKMEQEQGEDVAKYASRVETAAGTIREHFPHAPVVVRDKFFKGLRERLQNRIRHKYDDSSVNYLVLLELARKAETEINQRYKDPKKDKVPVKKGGIFPLIKSNQAKLSVPDDAFDDEEPEEEPLPGEDPVDRLASLEKQIVELKRAAFGTTGANGPARPTSSNLRPSAPAFKPKPYQPSSQTYSREQGEAVNKTENQNKAGESNSENMSKEDIEQQLKLVCFNCRGIGHTQKHCPTPFRVYLNGRTGSIAGGYVPADPKPKAS